MRSRVRVKGIMMSSEGDDAPQSGAQVASDESTTAGSGGDNQNGGLSELQEQAASALRNLADRYESESKEADAQVAKLTSDLKAAEARATRSAAEADRIRTEADRVATKPDWLTATSADESVQEATAAPANTAPATSDTATSSGNDEPVTTPDPPVPGPGPARGFALPAQPAQPAQPAEPAQPTSDTASGSAPGTASGSGTGSGSEDWAPRPFESWRNQTSS
jgi:hypothetical protein